MSTITAKNIPEGLGKVKVGETFQTPRGTYNKVNEKKAVKVPKVYKSPEFVPDEWDTDEFWDKEPPDCKKLTV